MANGTGKNTIMQFLSYTLIGCIATFVHYVILLSFVELLYIIPWQASIWGALFGAFVSYTLNRSYTFSETTKPHTSAFLRFLTVAIFGALFNGFIVWMGTIFLDMHYLIAQGLATLITFITTFKFNKSWTFM